MYGVSRVAGVGPTVKLGGRTYVIRAKIIEDLGLIEAEVVKRRGNPFDMLRQAADSLKDHPDVLERVVTQVLYDAKNWNFVDSTELYRFLYDSHDGFMFALWCCLRRDAKGLTLEDVNRLYAEEFQTLFSTKGAEAATEFKDSLQRAIQQAEGEDELGNSTGSTSAVEPTESQTVTDDSTGTNSGSSSSTTTAESTPSPSGS